MRLLALLVLLPLLWVCDVPAQDAGTVQIAEWPVPWENSRPRDPYVDAQGRIWFVGQTADYVAYLDPATRSFERYELEAGAGPHNVVVDPEGVVWYAGNAAAHIGRLDPRTGEITKIPMPDPAARDPHTLVFDGAGDLWFTVQGGNFVGRLARESGAVQLIPVPTEGARPYGIVVDAKGRPWLTEFGSNKLAVVDPAAMTLREIALPRPEARARRLVAASDGAIWYVDYAGGYLGRLDPDTEAVEEWPVPGGAEGRPYGMAVDEQDRIWFVETGADPNRFVGFDPRAKSFTSVVIPSGAGAVRHMYYHPSTRMVWFGTDANTIGRALLPE